MEIGQLICKCDAINIDEYIKYREEVKKHMEHPDWLGDFSKEDLENILKTGSKIWMYYEDNEFVCSMMMLPSDDEVLSKFEIDLDSKIVVDYGPMFVNYKYIGNGLQLKMLKELDRYCSEKGFRYAVVTVHPDNAYSTNNLIKDGFEMIRQREFTRGIRNIYLKKL